MVSQLDAASEEVRAKSHAGGPSDPSRSADSGSVSPSTGSAEFPGLRGLVLRVRKMTFNQISTVITQILTVCTLLVLVYQTIQLAHQTEELADQTQQLTAQTQQNQDSLSLSASAAELSFNLEVMKRNQEVMFKVEETPECKQYVWAKQLDSARKPSGLAVQCGDAILDVLSMALAAVGRMPGFGHNGDDWESYTRHMMQSCPNLRQRVLDNPEWWPEVTPYAR
jgi:hypothetical protein